MLEQTFIFTSSFLIHSHFSNTVSQDTFGSLKKYILKIALSQFIPEITPLKNTIAKYFFEKHAPSKNACQKFVLKKLLPQN